MTVFCTKCWNPSHVGGEVCPVDVALAPLVKTVEGMIEKYTPAAEIAPKFDDVEPVDCGIPPSLEAVVPEFDRSKAMKARWAKSKAEGKKTL